MTDNRERDISRLLGSAWSKKFEKFLEDLAPVGPATAKKYLVVIRALLGNRGLFSVDEASRFIKRKNRIYVRAAILKFVDFLEHDDIITEDEAAIWKRKLPMVKEPPAKPREIPTVQEILKVIETLDKDERQIAKFMFYTGCRIHEALSVKMRDVDFKTGRVILYGKGRLEKKPRPAKIPMDFASEIQAYVKDLGILEAETIFWPNSKASLESKVDMFNRKLKKACEEILGRSTGSHDFRRIVATRLLEESGRDLQLVQRIMGHEKIETTLKYTQFVDREKDLDKGRDIMENLGKNNEKER